MYDLKQIESIFPKNQLDDLISDNLKEIMQLQINIKLNNVERTAERGKHYHFSKCFVPIVFLRDIKSELVNEIKDIDKSKIPVEKSVF